jgi:hypothetical protein
MIALKVLCFVPFWLTVGLTVAVVLVFDGEYAAEEFSDTAQAFWAEWR